MATLFHTADTILINEKRNVIARNRINAQICVIMRNQEKKSVKNTLEINKITNRKRVSYARFIAQKQTKLNLCQ